MTTRIDIKTPAAAIALAGNRAFVDEYLGHLRKLGTLPGRPEAEVEVATPEEDTSIDGFLERQRIDVGRMSIQDLVVVFGYYVTRIRRRPWFTAEDIDFHFAHAGLEPPRNLANALGILKRKRNFIDAAEQRGTYSITPQGERFVASLARA